jgi:uncharacterized membrane protein YedE/YeeE
MPILISFISGLIMALGLVISGMANPAKVLAFLDIFGAFDPTLVFVMAGALLVTGIGYQLLKCCSKPICSESFDNPKNTKLDRDLILGSILFGAGWGLAGFCPGPAMVGLGLGLPQAFVLTSAMLIGMFIARRFLLK